MAAITATTRLRFLTFPQRTSLRRRLRTGGRNRRRPRLPRRRKDMNQHCIVRNMRHQRHRLLCRPSTNPHTRHLTARNSTLGHHMLPMASRLLQAPHIQHRPQMHHTLCTPRFLSDPPTPQTPIHSPTEYLDPARSHRPCRRLHPVPRPLPRSRGTQQMPRFPVARWMTCQKSRTGGSAAAGRLISKLPRTV